MLILNSKCKRINAENNQKFVLLKTDMSLLLSSSVLVHLTPGKQSILRVTFSPKKFLISTTAPLSVTMAYMGK